MEDPELSELEVDDPEPDVVDRGLDGEPDELDGADPVVVEVVVLVI